jgi:hypothetical protein
MVIQVSGNVGVVNSVCGAYVTGSLGTTAGDDGLVSKRVYRVEFSGRRSGTIQYPRVLAELKSELQIFENRGMERWMECTR